MIRDDTSRGAAALACLVALVPAMAGCARPARVATAPPAAVEPAPGESAPSARDRLEQDILAAIHAPGVGRGLWGIAVHSLDRDERLIEINSAAMFVPASVAKIVSLASAADAVGWDFQWQTKLLLAPPGLRSVRLPPTPEAPARLAEARTAREGGQADPDSLQADQGVLHGDLIVVGSGDPSIGGRGGADLSVFVDALKARGVRRIDGRVIGDDDALEEPRPQLAWAWDDLGYTSGAIFGALNLAENRLTVTIAPGAAAGLPTMLSVEPHAAYRPIVNRTTTVAPDGMQLLWPEQRPGETSLTIAGFIRAGATPVRLNVSAGNPTFWFASVLRSALVRGGIEVTGDAYDIDDVQPPPDRTAAEELYTYGSPPLSVIAQPMMKDSINLYAEAALRLNAAPGAFPTNDAALEGLNARLGAWGVPADAQQLIDGSGLSRRNVVSPEALLTVLRRMYDPAGASPFMTALPVAGVDGSLANRMRGTPAQGNVRAKTGTMSNIRSLAGYVTSADGERLALVVMVNNFEGSGTEAHQAIDAIAVRLATFTRGAATGPQPSSRPASR